MKKNGLFYPMFGTSDTSNYVYFVLVTHESKRGNARRLKKRDIIEMLLILYENKMLAKKRWNDTATKINTIVDK